MVTHEKALPANLEAERGVLSCLLYNPRHITKVADMLSAEHFVSDTNGLIYRAMQTLHRRQRACTVANVLEELSRSARLEDVAGGSEKVDPKGRVRDMLEVLQDSTLSLGNVEDYADSIKRTATHRRLIAIGAEIAAAGYAQDEDALFRAEELIYHLALGADTKSVAPLADVLSRYMRDFENRRADFQQGVVSGVPTGLTELDKLLGGLRGSKLYTLAARPGYGKTSLALTVALNVVKHARHALFFSLEMDEDELAQRLLAMETEIDQSFLRDGDVEDDPYQKLRWHARDLARHDLRIDDRTYLLADIRSKARKEHAKQPLDLIVVDYMQMIEVTPGGRAKNVNRAEEVAQISRDLKKLARELKVPVFALAQMNRNSEKENDRRPRLSDLGESSGLEKDSDVVMFVYCSPEEKEKRVNNDIYQMEVIVEKHRNGRVGTAPLKFRPRLTKFEDATTTEEGGRYGRPYADE